jgi:hypothetical protein
MADNGGAPSMGRKLLSAGASATRFAGRLMLSTVRHAVRVASLYAAGAGPKAPLPKKRLTPRVCRCVARVQASRAWSGGIAVPVQPEAQATAAQIPAGACGGALAAAAVDASAPRFRSLAL